MRLCQVFALPLLALLQCTSAFPLPRPVQERSTTTTQRGYSLDSYLETLSQIQSTVNSAGRGNTQEYLESLASLHGKAPSDTADEQAFTPRTAFTSLHYLESLSDVPPRSAVEYPTTSMKVTDKEKEWTPLDSKKVIQPQASTASDISQSTTSSKSSSLKVDIPSALQSTPVEVAAPLKPIAPPQSPVSPRGISKSTQALSPDSTKALFGERKAMAERKPIMSATEQTSLKRKKLTSRTNPESVPAPTKNVPSTTERSEEMLARISMAADYGMDDVWDVNTIKSLSPLVDITKVLADINENSHVSLQNGQDEATKSLTKWLKSTQVAMSNSTDMSVEELSERIAQGFFSLGELVVTALNLVAESVAGKSMSVAAKSAREAATDAIASAVASVMTTVQSIGEVSVAEVVHSMIELVVLIARVMFRIFNGAVEIVSGKSVGQMGQAVTNSFEKEAKAFSATKQELSEKSVYDLVVMLGKFELEAAEAVMATASNTVQSLEVSMLGQKKAASAL